MRRLSWILLAAACGGGADRDDTGASRDTTPPTASGPGASGYLRGIAIGSSGARRIALCGTSDTLQLHDPGNVLSLPNSAMFIVLAGQRSADRVTVERQLYVSGGRYECHADWSGFDYRATGATPGWVAEVNDSVVSLQREGGQTWRFAGVKKDSSSAGLRMTAPAVEGRAFDLTLQLRGCRGASGARSAWTARLSHGGDRLTGCAVPGVR